MWHLVQEMSIKELFKAAFYLAFEVLSFNSFFFSNIFFLYWTTLSFDFMLTNSYSNRLCTDKYVVGNIKADLKNFFQDEATTLVICVVLAIIHISKNIKKDSYLNW